MLKINRFFNRTPYNLGLHWFFLLTSLKLWDFLEVTCHLVSLVYIILDVSFKFRSLSFDILKSFFTFVERKNSKESYFVCLDGQLSLSWLNSINFKTLFSFASNLFRFLSKIERTFMKKPLSSFIVSRSFRECGGKNKSLRMKLLLSLCGYFVLRIVNLFESNRTNRTC